MGAPSEQPTRLLAVALADTISSKTKFLANYLLQEPTGLVRRLVLKGLMLGLRGCMGKVLDLRFVSQGGELMRRVHSGEKRNPSTGRSTECGCDFW